MQLNIKEIPTQYNLNLDSMKFECLHLNATVRRNYYGNPLDGWESDFIVTCPECRGADLDEWQSQDLIESFIEGKFK